MKHVNKKNLLLLGLGAGALALLASATGAAVTDQDIATLNMTGAVAQKTASPEGLGVGWILGRMALSLGVVFGLMWAVLWGTRKYLPQAAKNVRGGAIEVLASRPLGQRRSLMLVRVQGKMLLLGVTPGTIQTLTELESEAETATWHDAAMEAGLPAEGKVEFGMGDAK